MGLFSRFTKPSSSRASQFNYSSNLDQSPIASSSSSNVKSQSADVKSDPFNDPPPLYTPTDTAKEQWTKSTLQEPVIESDVDVLCHYDTIFIVDDSGSMLLDDSDSERTPKDKGKQIFRTRWEKARDALQHIVAMATVHDGDGVDIYFLNSDESIDGCTDPAAVMGLFRRVTPRGKTPTGAVLKQLITPYIDSITPWPEKADSKALPKPRNYIVITDGRPTDQAGSRLTDVIPEFCKRLDAGGVPLTQLGVQFLQVGDADDASEALKELDGDLKRRVNRNEIRDIVDTIPFDDIQGDINEGHIIKVLVGSINKRVDKTHYSDL